MWTSLYEKAVPIELSLLQMVVGCRCKTNISDSTHHPLATIQKGFIVCKLFILMNKAEIPAPFTAILIGFKENIIMWIQVAVCYNINYLPYRMVVIRACG